MGIYCNGAALLWISKNAQLQCSREWSAVRFCSRGLPKRKGYSVSRQPISKPKNEFLGTQRLGWLGLPAKKERVCVSHEKKLSPQTAAGPVQGHADFDEMPSIWLFPLFRGSWHADERDGFSVSVKFGRAVGGHVTISRRLCDFVTPTRKQFLNLVTTTATTITRSAKLGRLTWEPRLRKT